jgi:hypothetical protein
VHSQPDEPREARSGDARHHATTALGEGCDRFDGAGMSPARPRWPIGWIKLTWHSSAGLPRRSPARSRRSEICSVAGDLIRERRAGGHNLGLSDAVPDRQDALFARHAPRHEPVQLVLRPVLGEEGLRQDDDAEATVCQAVVNPTTKAIADLQLSSNQTLTLRLWSALASGSAMACLSSLACDTNTSQTRATVGSGSASAATSIATAAAGGA